MHYYQVMQKNNTHTSVLFQRIAGFTAALFISCAPVFVSAQSFVNPLGETNLYGFLFKILNAAVYILFPVIVLMFVYTGFLFVAAQGNPAEITKARQALLWTVIGALVLLGSKALALAICGTVKSINESSVAGAC